MTSVAERVMGGGGVGGVSQLRSSNLQGVVPTAEVDASSVARAVPRRGEASMAGRRAGATLHMKSRVLIASGE